MDKLGDLGGRTYRQTDRQLLLIYKAFPITYLPGFIGNSSPSRVVGLEMVPI